MDSWGVQGSDPPDRALRSGDVGIDVLRAEEAVVSTCATCLLYLVVAGFCGGRSLAPISTDGVGDIVEHAAPIVWAKGGIVNPGDDMSGLIHPIRRFSIIGIWAWAHLTSAGFCSSLGCLRSTYR